MIKFQDKLYEKLKNLTILPKSLILEGDEGCGKKSFVKDIADKFHLNILDISELINSDMIEQMILNVQPTLYQINIEKVSIKDQNRLLKIIEEPLDTTFIVILCENKNQIINTILNRCQIWLFNRYSKESLLTFLPEDNNNILKFCTTPGQILKYRDFDLIFLEKQAKFILEKINAATLPNAFSLSKYVAFDDKYEKQKYPLKLFLNSLLIAAKDLYSETNNKLNEIQYRICDKYYNRLLTPRIDQKYLFDSCIIELRKLKVGD